MELIFQSPRGDFGFLKLQPGGVPNFPALSFQSPRGDFGFLKALRVFFRERVWNYREFQSPRGDFGFLKTDPKLLPVPLYRSISIPSRGFWFFEGRFIKYALGEEDNVYFNPLAGILVF